MNDDKRIVAVGLLSARDIERLGPRFEHAYPIAGDHAFEDLLVALNAIPWEPNAERPARQGIPK